MFESIGGGVIYHTNTKQQKACVTILSDKVDFKTKSISRGKEGDLCSTNIKIFRIFFEFVFLHVFLFKNVYCEIYVYIYI